MLTMQEFNAVMAVLSSRRDEIDGWLRSPAPMEAYQVICDYVVTEQDVNTIQLSTLVRHGSGGNGTFLAKVVDDMETYMRMNMFMKRCD